MSRIPFTAPDVLVRPNVNVYQEGRTILPEPVVGIDPGVNLFGVAAQGLGMLGEITGQYLQDKRETEQQDRMNKVKEFEDNFKFYTEMSYINGTEEQELPKLQQERASFYNQMLGTKDYQTDPVQGRFNVAIAEAGKQGQRDADQTMKLKSQEFLVNSRHSEELATFDNRYNELVTLLEVAYREGQTDEIPALQSGLDSLFNERTDVLGKMPNRRLRFAASQDLAEKKQRAATAGMARELMTEAAAEQATFEAYLSDINTRIAVAEGNPEIDEALFDLEERLRFELGAKDAPDFDKDREGFLRAIAPEKAERANQLLDMYDKLQDNAGKRLRGIAEGLQKSMVDSVKGSAMSGEASAKTVTSLYEDYKSLDMTDPRRSELYSQMVRESYSAETQLINLFEAARVDVTDDDGLVDLSKARQAVAILPQDTRESVSQALAAIEESRRVVNIRVGVSARKQQAKRLNDEAMAILNVAENRAKQAPTEAAKDAILQGAMAEIAEMTRGTLTNEAFSSYRSDRDFVMVPSGIGAAPLGLPLIALASDSLRLSGLSLSIDTVQNTPFNRPFKDTLSEIQSKYNDLQSQIFGYKDSSDARQRRLTKRQNDMEVMRMRFANDVISGRAEPTSAQIAEASETYLSNFLQLRDEQGALLPVNSVLEQFKEDHKNVPLLGDVMLDFYGAELFDILRSSDPNDPAANANNAKIVERLFGLHFANQDYDVTHERVGPLPLALMTRMQQVLKNNGIEIAAEGMMPFAAMPNSSRLAMIAQLEAGKEVSAYQIARLRMFNERLESGGSITLETVRNLWNTSRGADSVMYNHTAAVVVGDTFASENAKSSVENNAFTLRDQTFPNLNLSLVDSAVQKLTNGSYTTLQKDVNTGLDAETTQTLKSLMVEAIGAVLAGRTEDTADDFFRTDEGKALFADEFSRLAARRYDHKINGESKMLELIPKRKTVTEIDADKARQLTMGQTTQPVKAARMYMSSVYQSTGTESDKMLAQSYGIPDSDAVSAVNAVLENVQTFALNTQEAITNLENKVTSLFPEDIKPDNARIMAATALINSGSELTPKAVEELAAGFRTGKPTGRFQIKIHNDAGRAIMLAVDNERQGRIVAANRLQPIALEPGVYESMPDDIESLSKDINPTRSTINATERKFGQQMLTEGLESYTRNANGGMFLYKSRQNIKTGNMEVYRSFIPTAYGTAAPYIVEELVYIGEPAMKQDLEVLVKPNRDAEVISMFDTDGNKRRHVEYLGEHGDSTYGFETWAEWVRNPDGSISRNIRNGSSIRSSKVLRDIEAPTTVADFVTSYQSEPTETVAPPTRPAPRMSLQEAFGSAAAALGLPGPAKAKDFVGSPSPKAKASSAGGISTFINSVRAQISKLSKPETQEFLKKALAEVKANLKAKEPEEVGLDGFAIGSQDTSSIVEPASTATSGIAAEDIAKVAEVLHDGANKKEMLPFIRGVKKAIADSLPTEVLGIWFKFNGYLTLRDAYREVYGNELGDALISEAFVKQAQEPGLGGVFMPQYDETADRPVPTYATDREMSIGGAYSKKKDKAIFAFAPTESEASLIRIHEMSHAAQSTKQSGRVTPRLVKEFDDLSTLEGIAASSLELPAYIAGLKARYYVETGEALRPNHTQVELQAFYDWLDTATFRMSGEEGAARLIQTTKQKQFGKVIQHLLKTIAVSDFNLPTMA